MSKCVRISMVLVLISLTIAARPCFSAGEIPISIGVSDIEPDGQDTLYIHNFTSPVASGSYWATFQWDPERLVFYPIDVGTDNITPPYRNLVGAYTLKAYTVIYRDGTVFNEKNSDGSGVMLVENSTISQSVTINGKTSSGEGSYSLKFKGIGGGSLVASDSTGTHALSFWTAPHEIMIYSGIISLGASNSFEEWDLWEKTSDDVATFSTSTSSAKEDGGKPLLWIGELFCNSTR